MSRAPLSPTRATTALLGSACLLAIVAIAASAGAEPPAPRTGARPSFAALPSGHVLPPPNEAPAHVGPREKADGIFTAPAPESQMANMRAASPLPPPILTYVAADRALLADLPNGDAFSRGTDACIVDGGTIATREQMLQSDWPLSPSTLDVGQAEPKGALGMSRLRGPAGRTITAEADVHVMHAEHFVPGVDGRAALDVVDAWVDMRTRGVRLIDRYALPLARIFTGPTGLEAYAARDGDSVQVVLHVGRAPVDDPALARALQMRQRGLSVVLPEQDGASSNCGTVRFVLQPSNGGGQTATLQATAFLPPLDGDWGKGAEGEREQERGERLLEAMRGRPYQLSVSATKTSADHEPVLSVALGWAGREQPGSMVNATE